MTKVQAKAILVRVIQKAASRGDGGVPTRQQAETIMNRLRAGDDAAWEMIRDVDVDGQPGMRGKVQRTLDLIDALPA